MAKIEEWVGDNFFASAKKAIQEEQLNTTVQIDYDRFVKEMLPYFAGKEESDNFYGAWVNFIGGVNVTANIVKNETECVLTIPPMFSGLDLTGKDRKSAQEVFNEYKNLAPINPTVAQAKLESALSGWMGESSVVKTYGTMVAWNRILTDNGYEGYDLSELESILSPEEKARFGVDQPTSAPLVAQTHHSDDDIGEVDDGFNW